MAKSKRIDVKDLTRGAIIALPVDHPDALHLHPNDYIAFKGGSIDYSRYLNRSLYSSIGDPGDGFENEDQNPGDPTFDELLDIPSLTDIESILYEPYYDPVSKLQKVRALIKIRNSSKNSTNIAGVDARIFNPSTVVPRIPDSDETVSRDFVTPNPSVPNVIFKRDGTAISWGWNDSTGLGSYASVTYDWIISSSSSPSASALDTGTKTYPSSTNYQIGTGSAVRKYRVSSRNGHTAPTSSPRWLRVKTIVIGTDGQTYQSSYSSPL
jgi:hypothetical protein